MAGRRLGDEKRDALAFPALRFRKRASLSRPADRFQRYARLIYSMNAITTRNLGKKYEIYPRPLNRLGEWLSFGKAQLHDDFWALKGVNLEVKAGQTLGILGPNGAGKSTLLKILGGVAQPSEGSIEMNGRVTGLLELGAGFHPEFTGRDNAIMSCSLLGMSRSEINNKLDEIIEFSEIGDFIDQPVKTYSSGMYMRLGFSVATCVDPDILLVDEALAVGDEYFVEKCTERFNDLRKRGTTIVLVTHLIKNIRLLCDKAILIDNGRILDAGDPDMIADEYLNLVTARFEQRALALTERKGGPQLGRPPEIEFLEIEILDKNGKKSSRLAPGEPFAIRGRYRVNQDVETIVIGLYIYKEDGTRLITHFPFIDKILEKDWQRFYDLSRFTCAKKAGQEGYATCHFDHNPLIGGTYSAHFWVLECPDRNLPRYLVEPTRPTFFAVSLPPSEFDSQFHCKARWEDTLLDE